MKQSSNVRISYPELLTIIVSALVAAGLTKKRAALEAEIMLEADLHGTPSHGIRMLPGLLSALGDGRVNPRPKVALIRQKGAVCTLNGDNGPGRSVAIQAMRHAMTRARRSGIGACLAIRTTHWGRAHTYACRAALEGLIGICSTNGMPCMAGWGASSPIIGNNPLAIGIPRQDATSPVVLDMAMSQAAVGKVATWLREGRELPPDWGLDRDGKASRDGGAILAGTVLPFGGHKGAGLALMLELLTAGLAGSSFGAEIKMSDRSGLDPESAKLFVALDPDFFSSLKTLASRVDDFLGYLKENGATQAPMLWPGERGWRQRAVNMAEGVPVHGDIVAELRAAGVHIC